jgi:hypothetical protein
MTEQSPVRRAADAATEAAEAEQAAYSGGEDRPLGGYLVVMGIYASAVAGLGYLARRQGRTLPERVPFGDIALGAMAAHKVARLLSKDSVTSPLRAPFTRYQGPAGHAELAEQVRGEGVRHAIGELITCPFCLDQWVATTYAAGLVFSPRVTRLVASVFAARAGADFLQLGYAIAQRACS